MAREVMQAFTSASRHVEKIRTRLSEGQLLALYGLYKQALQGDIPFAKPVFEDRVDPKVVAKWQVWHDCSGIGKEEAARQYIHLLRTYDPSWDPYQQSAPNSSPPQTTGGNAQGKRAQRQRRGQQHSSAVASLTSGVTPKSSPAASPAAAQPQRAPPEPQESPPPPLAPLRDPSSLGAAGAPKAGSQRGNGGGRGGSADGGAGGGAPPAGYGFSENNGVVEGVLFKQRDVFKGWRERFFRLEDQVLNYYINNPADDPTPRNSILMVSCDITAIDSPISSSAVSSSPPPSPNGSSHGTGTTTANGRNIFPFVISHPASSKTYKLAAKDIPTRDRWINALRRAAGTQDDSAVSATALPAEPPSPALSTDTSAVGNTPGSVLSSSPGGGSEGGPGSENVPPSQWKRVGSMLDRFMRMTAQSSGSGDGTWVPFGEKLGVQGFKLASSDKFVTVKGEGVVNHSVGDVFRLLFDPVDKKSYDSQLDEGARLAVYNSQTVCDHLQLKAIWPTTARDFLNLVHWRVVSPDTVVLIAFHSPASECSVPTHPKAMPQDGVVRGEVKIAGWKMKALHDAASGNGAPQRTLLTYVVQSDIKGNLPAAIVNTVAQQQAFLIAAVEKELNRRRAASENFPAVELSNAALTNVADEINRRLFDGTGSSDKESVASYMGTSSVNGGLPAASVTISTASPVASPSTPQPADAVSMATAAAALNQPAQQQQQQQRASNSPSRSKGDSAGKEITSRRLAVLFVPSVLWWLSKHGLGRPLLGSILFCVSLVMCFMHLVEINLGKPAPKRCLSSHWGAPVTGSAVFRFPIELKRLLRYLENKRQASGIEINVTHVTIKAAAMALQEMPSLNGHICLNRFYRNQSSDVSYLFPLASGGFTSVVVNSAETKAVDVVSRELLDLVGQANTQREPFVQRRREILGHLPPLIADAAERIFGFIGSQLGISVPSLGIRGFPFGTCTVVTPPAEGPEMEVDVIGNNGVGQPTMAPVVISVGGIRVQSGYMKDKQMAARPVLHMSAAVDLRCATVFEAKQFFERLQTLLRDPSLLEKASSGRT